ncbi:hypothetical protein [Embleya sp. NBC_00896]|uniref:hypothetical protein n=1 Tax=Embleya sp. NBC_00896 TaxID=2975961 RepID=UPI00387006D6|nr:hypothetical protein OG928_19480 [Embleya sp. NBC_00896]
MPLQSGAGKIRPVWLTATLVTLMCAAMVAWMLVRADHDSRAQAAPGRDTVPSNGPRTDAPGAARTATGDPTPTGAPGVAVPPADDDAKPGATTDPQNARMILNIDGRSVVTDRRGLQGARAEVPARDIRIEAISPTADRVAGNVLTAGDTTGPGLRVESLDGSDPVNLTPKDGAYIQPEFSADGGTLFFTHTVDPRGSAGLGARIMSVPAKGGSAPKQLFDNANEFCDSTFAASRAGVYSFTRARKAPRDARRPDAAPTCESTGGVVALYNAKDGSVTDVPRPKELPPVNPLSAISPDGKQLAIVSVVTHSIRLYVQDLESGKLTLIPGNATNMGGGVRPVFDWSPDSRQIAIDHQDAGAAGISRTVAYDSRTGKSSTVWPDGSRTPVWQPERSS